MEDLLPIRRVIGEFNTVKLSPRQMPKVKQILTSIDDTECISLLSELVLVFACDTSNVSYYKWYERQISSDVWNPFYLPVYDPSDKNCLDNILKAITKANLDNYLNLKSRDRHRKRRTQQFGGFTLGVIFLKVEAVSPEDISEFITTMVNAYNKDIAIHEK